MKMRIVILFFLLPILAFAEESALEKFALRQAAFGRTIPQEKVFVHMDNTSYQLGDTIWFTAYTRRTDTDKPSDVSGVLIGLGFMQVLTADFGVGVIERKYGEGQEKTFEVRNGVGFTRRMILAMRGDSIPEDSIYVRKYLRSTHDFDMSPGEALEYQGNGVWDMYVFYSDYSPRQYGNSMYYGSNEPKTTLVRYPFRSGSRRLTYRDRRYVIPGFAYPAQFYSPDYSKQKPSEDKKDYRRTLYWNPNLKLNDEGEAEVTFYNNSRVTQLSVDAEGQSSDGTLLWAK